MKNLKQQLRGLVLLVVVLTASSLANASPIIFTVSARADGSSYGYVGGQLYTFIFTMNDSFNGSEYLDTDYSYFYSNSDNWQQDIVGEDRIWSAVTGTGVGGELFNPQAPAARKYSAFSYLQTNGTSALGLFAGVGYDNLSNGLSTADGQRTLGSVYASVGGLGLSFGHSGTYTDPNLFFADYLGTYSIGGGQVLLGGVINGDRVASFTATELIISSGATMAAVPESSSTAMLVAFGTLGLVGFRCRPQDGSEKALQGSKPYTGHFTFYLIRGRYRCYLKQLAVSFSARD